MKCTELLTKAKTTLILDQPFFASLLLSMPIIEDKSIATLATNGEYIKFNPTYVESLSLQETVFVLAHEVLHSVFEHMYRRGNREPKQWNAAADYIINDTLVKEFSSATSPIARMPAGALLDSDMVQKGRTTEGVYDLLGKNQQQQQQDKSEFPGVGEQGGSLDECQDAQGDAAEVAAKESETRVKVVQAANAAKMCGKLSAGLSRLVNELTKTKVDWKSVLRRFLTERAKVEYSYAKPKRRFLAEDIILPSLNGESLGNIVIAIDCSRSISESILAEFSAECNAIHEDMRPASVTILYFDTSILKTQTYGPDDTLSLEFIGGGGTAFSPIFAHIEQEQIAPTACVVLTDLECNNFGTHPDYPVLWASIASGTAPFGEVLLIK